MSFLDIVFRALNKDGDAFIELRREDGHGSSADKRTYIHSNHLQPMTKDEFASTDFANNAKLTEIKDKITASAATEARQIAGNSTLTLILAKIIAAPATAAKQLPDGHNVTLTNPTANPETGLAKETTLGQIKAKADNLDVAASTRASEVTLLNVIAQQALLLTAIQDVKAAVNAVELTAENISINSDAINLNTDTLETLMQSVRDRLPTSVGQVTNAASLPVTLSTEQQAILQAISSKDFALQSTQALALTAAQTRNNRFSSLLKFEANVGEELRIAVVGTDTYHLRAADGTALGAATWEAVRFYKTAGKTVRTRYRTGVTGNDPSTGWT